MPPVLDPAASKVDGLAFLGLSLARKSDVGHEKSQTHQTVFDLNEVLDRDYKYIFSTNDDGWLVGGGEPQSSFKLAAKDSAHVEIMRIGTYEPKWGGVSQEEIIEALRSGKILIPEMEVVPTAVVANGDQPPELEIRFDMAPQDDPTELPVNWQLRFVHNQLFEYFQFPSRFCPGAFHSTIVRKAEFRSKDHETEYFDKCAKAVKAWRKAGPQPLRASSLAEIEAIHCKPKRETGPDDSDCSPFTSLFETMDDFLTPSRSPEATSGIYLFRDRNTITHYFTPNFVPNTPEKVKYVRNVISEYWDETSMSWKSNQSIEKPTDPKSSSPPPPPETGKETNKKPKRPSRGRGKAMIRSGLFRMRRTPQGIVEEIPLSPRSTSFRLKPIGRRPTCLALFHVGDIVKIHRNKREHLVGEQKEEEGGIFGRIQDVRGSGWYDVAVIDPGQGEVLDVMKCRSSQLLRVGNEDYRIGGKNSTNNVDSSSTEDLAESLLPVPSIRNYDDLPRHSTQNDLLHQAELFQTYQHWIAFTDLHCATATVNTCVQVLQKVHFEATRRNAGILFLGDWWHVRGSLRVDLVNAMLSQLATWTQPMIMIPGNHDQNSWHANEDHALRIFHNAYRLDNTSGVMVLSYPTRFMDALFVPHIRSPTILDAILQAAVDVPTIFCHADITGSSMNDNVVSQGGIHPSAFGNRLAYTGHFHKPHMIGNRIVYLGSPYEVSLAEAEQEKKLVVVDRREGWNIVESIPMGDIGRKHYKPKDLSDFVRVIDRLKPGDRVVFDQPKHLSASDQQVLNNNVQNIRRLGAMCEVRPPSATKMDDEIAETRRTRIEAVSPSHIWSSFLDQQMDRGLADPTMVEKIRSEGLKIMEEVEEESAGTISVVGAATKLQFRTVDIQGFGPFVESTSYDLYNKGLVLLRGVNEDDGADSNGSGKTSLAISVLWAFTGSIDPRPVQDGKVSEVINDLCENAKVTVRGTINGKAFTVSRTKTRTKGELTFILDERDRTAQSIKETQKIIDEALGISTSLLSRVVFHGQHATNDLLDATDAKLKDEFSQFVPLELWQKCSAHTRKRTKEITEQIKTLEGMVTIRTDDLNRLNEQQTTAEDTMRVQRDEYSSLEKMLENKFSALNTVDNMTSSYSDLEKNMERARKDYDQTYVEREQFKNRFDRHLLQVTSERSIDETELQSAHDAYKAAEKKIQDASQQLTFENKSALELKQKLENVKESGNCPLCHQTLGDDSQAEETIAKELEVAFKSIETLEQALSDFEARKQLCWRELERIEDRVRDKNAHRTNETSTMNDEQCRLDLRLKDAGLKLDEATNAINEFARTASQRAEISDLEKELASSERSFAEALRELERVTNEVNSVQNELTQKKKDTQELDSILKVLKELTDLFGSRGVQSFVLQNALSFLGFSADSYLSQLSQGTQKLELKLDTDDRISRRALVRGTNSIWQERALSALSGGQWRRTSLALQLAVGDYVRQHCFQSSLIVFDEPLIHLDQTGRSDVGRVFRSLLSSATGLSTLIVILQDLSADELEEYFDCIDKVVRSDGRTKVVSGES